MIGNLPPEIIHQVCQYLNFTDLIILKGISKDVKDIIESPIVWKSTVCVVGNHCFHGSLNAQMTSVKIPLNEQSCAKFGSYLKRIQQLTTSPYHDLDYTTAHYLFPFLENVRCVDLSRNDDINDQTISLLTSSCPKMKSLNLNHCRKLSFKSMFMIAQQLHGLESLYVSSTRLLTNKSWLVLCALNASLKELYMSNCPLLDWDLVVGILPPELQYWDISNNFTISFGYLNSIIESRKDRALVIDARNCGNITGEEVDMLRCVSDRVTILANPLLRNHNQDGVREYLEYILGRA